MEFGYWKLLKLFITVWWVWIIGKMAERSKALCSGRSPKGRGFEFHSCHNVRRCELSKNNPYLNPISILIIIFWVFYTLAACIQVGAVRTRLEDHPTCELLLIWNAFCLFGWMVVAWAPYETARGSIPLSTIFLLYIIFYIYIYIYIRIYIYFPYIFSYIYSIYIFPYISNSYMSQRGPLVGVPKMDPLTPCPSGPGSLSVRTP